MADSMCGWVGGDSSRIGDMWGYIGLGWARTHVRDWMGVD